MGRRRKPLERGGRPRVARWHEPRKRGIGERSKNMRARAGSEAGSRGGLQKVLLACGVLYSAAYVVANDLIAAAHYRGYSRTSHAVSELSATGAPTKAFLAATIPV